MKNILPISIIVVALFALGGAYAFKASKTGNPLPFLGATPTPSGSSGVVGTGAPTPTAAPLSQINLVVSSPTDKESVTDSKVKVTGKTVANADVSVNDKDIKADANGNFSVSLDLDEGENIIDVVASDADGNASEQTLTVTFNPSAQ